MFRCQPIRLAIEENPRCSNEPIEATYFPHAQQPVRAMSFVVRSARDVGSLAPAVRQAIAEIDPTLPVFDVSSLEAKMADDLAGRRFLAVILGTFAALAVTLAGLGLYGVLSFLVARRTREIGIRMALGAEGSSVLGMVLRQGGALAVLGLVIGVAGSLGLTRLLATQLYEVSTTDPGTFVIAPLLLALVAIAACYLPARRATRVDPVTALRED